jgi:flagellar basal-body rod protein FlgC
MISSVNNSALSALRAFSTGLQSNSNNIANANTNGFKKTRVTMATTETDGVKANVEKVNTAGAVIYQEGTTGSEEVELSNVDLGQELPEMSLNSNFYKANLKTLQVADEMVGNLLKLKA